MRKTLLLLCLLLILAPFAEAQYQFGYANKLTPGAVTLLDYQVVDNKQYLFYEFTGSFDADPGTATLTLSSTSGNGLNTAYALVTLNEDGTYNRSFQFESQAISIKPQFAILPGGEAFILMRSTPTGVALDPSDLSTITHSINGHVIAKYSETGQLLFSKTSSFFAPTNNNNLHLKVRSDGGFTMGLTVRGLSDMDFDTGTINNFGTNSSINHLFIGQYSPQAVFQTGVSIPLNGSESANIKGFELDNNGNIYVLGYTKTNTDLDPSPTTAFAIGGKTRDNNYLVKYNANLDFEWGQNFGTGTMAGNRNLALLPNNNVVIGGRTPWESLYTTSASAVDRDRLNLNPRNTADPIDGVTPVNAGIFLVEYNSANGDYVTSSVFGGTDSSGESLLSLQGGSQHVIAGIKTTEAVAIGSLDNYALLDGDFLVLGLSSSSSVPVFAETFGPNFEISGASQTAGKLLITGLVTGSEDVDSGHGVVNISATGRQPVNVGMNMESFTTSTVQQEICWEESIDINGYTLTDDGLYTVFSNSSLDEDLKTITTLSEFGEIAASFNVVGASNGAANGSIAVSASGGKGNFTYSINGGSPGTSATFSGLSAGSYTIEIFSPGSVINCSETFTVVISALMVTASISQPVACNGDQALVAVSATGGQAPYTFSLDNVSYQAVSDFSLVAGTYNIYSKDANNDAGQTSITITEPAVAALAVQSVQNEQCFDQKDGSITVTASGGTGPYSYFLNNEDPQSSPTFTGLTAGTYVLGLLDANGCVAATTATITSPSEITTDVANTPATACGMSDGTITVSNTNGGAGNYEYKLDAGNFQTSGNFTGLSSGIYQLTVKDANSCTTQKEVVITEPTSITAIAGFKDPTCFGANDGEAFVNNVSGGSGNYTYSIDGVNFQQSGTFTGLAEGRVNILIKDDMGCTAVKAVFLFEPPLLTVTASVLTHVTCKNGNDGSATITASGGASIYSYSSDGVNYGTLTNQPLTLTGLSAGLNTLYAKDFTGCIATVNVMINEPVGTTISVDTDTEITCFGNTNGAITIAATSPIAGALEYSLDGTTFGSSSSFTGLAAGDYTAYVKDPNGCIQEFDFAVDEPDQITATLAADNISCFGQTDGNITVTATGGTGTLSYSIDGTSFQASNSFQNLAAGSYTISIKDDNDCTVTISETISEPALLTLTFDSFSNPACNGDGNGSFSLSATGGTGPYEYSTDGTNFQSSGSFTNLSAGTYNFTLRDANGCTQAGVGILTDPAVLTSSATVNDQVSCFGGANGSATVTAAGGNSPYTYSLDGVSFDNTNGTFDALTAGNHTITTKDSNGCTTTSIVTITEPAAIVVSAVTDNQVTCNGGSDGAVSGSASGGTAPYTYSIDGVNFQNTPSFSGLGAGMVTLSIKDANDCIASATVQVTEPAPILLDAMVTPASCAGAGDASVTLVASNGVGAYEFSLDGGAFSANATFSDLTAGDAYVFTVKDANGCTASISPKVGEPGPLTLNFEAVDITCNGETDGQIAGFAQGGTAPFQYSLDGTNFQNGPFSNLTAGSYTLTVKDSQGCTTSQMAIINEPAVLTAASSIISQVSCNGAADGMSSIVVTGGSVPYSYSLDGTTFNNSVDLTALAPAIYTVTIRDANSCETTSSFTITEPEPLAASTETSAVLCNGGSNGGISVIAVGGTAPFTYAIDGGAFGSSDKFDNLTAGVYTITVKDSQGCTVTSNATVSEPDVIVISSTTVMPPLCSGDTNVEISVTASGGTGPLEYSLDGTNYQSSNSFTGLTAGTYDITILDANGCTATTSAIIADPTPLVLSTTVTGVLCFGESNGEISITASGGTGALEYSIDGTTFQSAATFTGLIAGDYATAVKDANGCTTTTTVTVAEPAVLSVSATIVSNNTINVTATGGTGPYEYAIDGTNFQSASSFSNLSNGDYTVTVRDANGCTATTSGSLIVTSVEDLPDFKLVQVYPNPVRDYMIFSGLEAGDEIRLVSLNGNSLDLTILTEAKNEYQMDISDIRQKVFLAIVVSKEGRIKLNKKVIKKE